MAVLARRDRLQTWKCPHRPTADNAKRCCTTAGVQVYVLHTAPSIVPEALSLHINMESTCSPGTLDDGVTRLLLSRPWRDLLGDVALRYGMEQCYELAQRFPVNQIFLHLGWDHLALVQRSRSADCLHILCIDERSEKRGMSVEREQLTGPEKPTGKCVIRFIDDWALYL